MIIDCISDLHGFFPEMAGGDLLLVGGDLTARNTFEGYEAFKYWLNAQKYRCKVVIGGNHDGLLEEGLVTFGDDIHYLCDSGLEFEGHKIWGSPYTPTFMTWYFMRDRGEPIKRHWDLIPANTDILVTHGPPYGILDTNVRGESVGCKDLREAVCERIKPRLHCFGHIHECGDRKVELGGTTFVNCSYVDFDYRPVHHPIRFQL